MVPKDLNKQNIGSARVLYILVHFFGLLCKPPGGWGVLKSFKRGGSTSRPKPLLFYIPFLIEKVPLSYAFHRKLYPFRMPVEGVLQNFSLEKPLKKTWMNQPLGASVRDILKSLF